MSAKRRKVKPAKKVKRARKPKAAAKANAGTARRDAFVRLYTAGPEGVIGNATKAAEGAGYSAKTAYAQGSRLLKNAEVRNAIDAIHEKAESKAVAALVEWKDLVPEAQGTLRDAMNGKLGDSAAQANVRVSAADKILDRAMGKPPVKMQHVVRGIDDVLEELDGHGAGG